MAATGSTVYVTVSGEDRIAVYDLNPATGALTPKPGPASSFAVSGRPGPLCLSPGGDTLYVSRRGEGELSSLAIDRPSGALTAVTGAVGEGGADAVFISLDWTGRFLLSCGSASVRVHRLGGGEDEPSGAGGGHLVAGRGPAASLGTSAGAHCVVADRSNRFVFVPHVAWDNNPIDGTPAERAAAKAGYDQSDMVQQFVFDGGGTPALQPNPVAPLLHYVGMGRGPRHLCFHPLLEVAYTTDEMSSTVTALSLDTAVGTLALINSVSTLPEGGRYADTMDAADTAVHPASAKPAAELQEQLREQQRARDSNSEPNSTAQLRVHPTGRFLFAPNRGHDSIACFAASPSDGALSLIEHVPTEPHTRGMDLTPDGELNRGPHASPLSFSPLRAIRNPAGRTRLLFETARHPSHGPRCLLPAVNLAVNSARLYAAGKFLLAAGVESGAVTVYAIDGTTGRLSVADRCIVGAQPMWVLVAPFAAAAL